MFRGTYNCERNGVPSEAQSVSQEWMAGCESRGRAHMQGHMVFVWQQVTNEKAERQRVFQVRQHEVLKMLLFFSLFLPLVPDAERYTWKAIRRGRTMQAATTRGVTMGDMKNVGEIKKHLKNALLRLCSGS